MDAPIQDRAEPVYDDVHCMAINGDDSRVYASTPFGIATSLDEGESWEAINSPKSHTVEG